MSFFRYCDRIIKGDTMKKIILLILTLTLFFLTGCGKNSSLDVSSLEEDVKTNLQEVSNVSKEDISLYLDVLISDYEDEDEVLYAAIYIQNVSAYLDNDNLNNFANEVISYLNGEDVSLDSYIEDIKNNKGEYVQMIYTSYHTKYTFKELFSNSNLQVIADTLDDSKKNYETIDKAISYIESYLDNPLLNNETSTKITYYSLFLSLMEGESISKLGNDTKEYLLSLDSDKKIEVNDDLESINKNREKYINECLKEVEST